MQHDLFTRPKVSASCLSHWQLGKLRAQLCPDEDATRWQAHIAACSHCQRAWDSEQALGTWSAAQKVPCAAPPRRRPWFTWLGFGSLGALTAAAVLLMLPRAPDTHLKGSAVPRVSVLRTDRTLVQEVALDAVPPLQVGDKVRIKASPNHWYVLEHQRDGTWQQLYAGPGDAQGFLPLALGVTAAPASALRLLSCPHKPSGAWPPVPAGCDLYAWQM